MLVDDVSDNLLIQETLAGHDHAFERLVVRYQDRLVHSLEQVTGSRDDALEIAQQAFVLAWRKLASFRAESQFYSWLYRIARNVAASHNRRRRIQTTSLESYSDASGFEPVADRDHDPERPLDQQEKIALVQSALQQIPEQFREALVLKEIDGFSYEQISEIMEIPMGTVRSRIFRARQELTERLRRLLDDL